jgi:hypothetical protein
MLVLTIDTTKLLHYMVCYGIINEGR